MIDTTRVVTDDRDFTGSPTHHEIVLTITTPSASMRRVNYEEEGLNIDYVYVRSGSGQVLLTEVTGPGGEVCDWEPDVVYLPSPNPAVGTQWATSASCHVSDHEREADFTGVSQQGQAGLARIHRTVFDRATTGSGAYQSRTETDEDYSVGAALVQHWVEDRSTSTPRVQNKTHREATLRTG